MAKRFITTTIFEDAWFMDLPAKYKLFWIFLVTNCDYTGIWQVNYKLARFYVGEDLEPGECERVFRDRIVKINEGKYWFIPKFIEFQYGTTLKESNKALEKVIEAIDKNDLLPFLSKITIDRSTSRGAIKPPSSSLQGAKEKEEVKEEVKVEEKVRSMWISVFLINPGSVEKGFVKELIEKHGEIRTKTILMNLREEGFHKIKTMREALDADGNIKPKVLTNETSQPASYKYID